MKKEKKHIIDVAPLTKIPLGRNQSFSYLSAEEIPAGSLVSVPLFKRTVEGVVTGARPDFERMGNIELKKVSSVLVEDFIDTKQIELARYISEHYLSPLGVVLKGFIPKRTKERRVKEDPTSIISKLPGKKITLTEDQKKAVEVIGKNKKSKFYLFGPAGSGKTEVYIHAILKLRKKTPDAQFLILLPELTLTPQAIERYGAYFSPESTVVLHSRITKGKFFSNWQKIKSGEAKIIIGSRMAVFAPFKKLGLIVIDEEQDMSFKQWDMNPRYDARVVAEKMAELHRAKIVFGSATPSVEAYYKTTQGEYELLEIPDLEIPGKVRPPKAETLLVDMKKERWKNGPTGPANFSSLSKKLQAEIAYALKNNLQVILFVNRQGLSNFSVCVKCKTVLKCPRCDRALVYEKSGAYKCLHCTYKSSVFPSCTKCKGLAFTNIGLGTQKVEREVQNIFSSAHIARVDNQTMQAPGAQEEIYADFAAGKVDILIGTQMLTKGWDLPNVALVGIIDADNLVSMPDFSTSFRAFQQIVQVSGRTGRPGSKWRGMVIIQTFNPQNYIFTAAAERDFNNFFAKEIKDRKELLFPPFGKLIKLIFQNVDSITTEVEAKRAFTVLDKLVSGQVSVSEPYAPLVAKIRNRFRQQIILKIAGEIPPDVRRALEALPAGWIIDVDPISIS